MAWPIYHNPSLKFFKTCAMHHQQTTYASIWNAVYELCLLLHPTQCFQLFRVCFVRQLGNWKVACLPHRWTEKSCLLNWGKREFGTAVLTGCQDYRWDWQRANRTCLSIMKEKKRKKEGEMQKRTFKESQMDRHCYTLSVCEGERWQRSILLRLKTGN